MHSRAPLQRWCLHGSLLESRQPVSSWTQLESSLCSPTPEFDTWGGEHNLTEVRKKEWLWHRALFSWHYHSLTYLRTYVLDLANRDSNPGNPYLSLSWTFSNSLVSSCESSFITSICSAKSGVTCHSSSPNYLKSRWNPLSFLNLWNDFQSFGWKKSYWNPLALRPQ